MNWTEGYVAELGYTYGYYPELNPLRARLSFLAAGIEPPKLGVSCELGFGQGLSINIHAAASGHEWHGTDFNPVQAGFAQQLAAVSGAGAHLHDEAFADFCARDDLPQFDSIGLHGIWSWISDDNRRVISDFIRRRLKVGGALYISYNTMPGWSTVAPLRHLLTQHVQLMSAQGAGMVSRIDGALEFADKLMAANPAYARANPQAAQRLARIKEQNRHYLAHEYFNRDWHPMYFATLAEWLAPAKLEYACSAHYTDHIDSVNLPTEQQAVLKALPDRLFRESVRDFMINQQFRRDFWVKGARRMSGSEQVKALRQERVVLTSHRPDVSLKVAGANGEVAMSEAVFAPVLDALADHQPRTLAQLEQALQGKNINFTQMLQAVLLLAGSGHLASAQEDAQASTARKSTDKLNAHLLQRARSSADIAFLASPVTGGGVLVARFAQLFLLAAQQGLKQPSEWADYAWQILASQGQKLLKDGKPLETTEQNLAELSSVATAFQQKQLPALKALQIV